MALGIPLGIYTALRKGHWDEQVASFFSLLAFCVPGLVLGPLLVMAFGIMLRWFPVAMWDSPRHAVLPTITLGLFFAGRIWAAPGLNKVIAFHPSQDVPYILRPFRLFRGLAVWLLPLSADRRCYAGGCRRARIFLRRRRQHAGVPYAKGLRKSHGLHQWA